MGSLFLFAPSSKEVSNDDLESDNYDCLKNLASFMVGTIQICLAWQIPTCISEGFRFCKIMCMKGKKDIYDNLHHSTHIRRPFFYLKKIQTLPANEDNCQDPFETIGLVQAVYYSTLWVYVGIFVPSQIWTFTLLYFYSTLLLRVDKLIIFQVTR